MSESSNRTKAGGSKPDSTPQNRNRPSPMLLGAVVGLAVIVVAVLVVLGIQTMGRPSAGTGDTSGMIEGTRKGPKDAKVVVLNFSDFQ